MMAFMGRRVADAQEATATSTNDRLHLTSAKSDSDHGNGFQTDCVVPFSEDRRNSSAVASGEEAALGESKRGFVQRRASCVGKDVPDRATEMWGRLVDEYLSACSMTLPDVAKVLVLQEQEQGRSPQGWAKYLVLTPDTVWKFYWDMLLIGFFVYTAFRVPYSLSFDDSTPPDEIQTPQDIFELILDIIYVSDVILTFFTARYDQGILQCKLKNIAILYVKNEFALDLGGSFPFDKVVAACAKLTGATNVNLTMMRAMKLIRLLRLLRGAKFLRFVKLLEEKSRGRLSMAIHIGQSVFVLVFTAHALGCFFVMVGNNEDPHTNWMHSYMPDWDRDNPNTEFDRYIVSLYWAIITISTMGYGDVLPKTTTERMFVIASAVIGAIIFGYCMGNIGQMLNATSGVDQILHERIKRLREYGDFRLLSRPLQERMSYHFREVWAGSGHAFQELEIIKTLPSDIRKLLLSEIGKRIMPHFIAFRNYDEDCIGAVFAHMCPVEIPERQVIYSKNDTADGMYFVMEGRVKVTTQTTFYQEFRDMDEYGDGTISIDEFLSSKYAKDMREVHRQQFINQYDPNRTGRLPVQINEVLTMITDVVAGNFFGELGLFPDLAPVRLDHAVAMRKAKLLLLTHEKSASLSVMYPTFISKLRQLCELQHLKIRPKPMVHTKSSSSGVDKKQGVGILEFKIARVENQLKKTSIKKLAKGAVGLHSMRSPAVVWINQSPEDPLGRWNEVTCMIRPTGEVLYVDHSHAGYSSEEPSSLGFIASEARSTLEACSPETARGRTIEMSRKSAGATFHVCTLRLRQKQQPHEYSSSGVLTSVMVSVDSGDKMEAFLAIVNASVSSFSRSSTSGTAVPAVYEDLEELDLSGPDTQRRRSGEDHAPGAAPPQVRSLAANVRGSEEYITPGSAAQIRSSLSANLRGGGEESAADEASADARLRTRLLAIGMPSGATPAEMHEMYRLSAVDCVLEQGRVFPVNLRQQVLHAMALAARNSPSHRRYIAQQCA